MREKGELHLERVFRYMWTRVVRNMYRCVDKGPCEHAVHRYGARRHSKSLFTENGGAVYTDPVRAAEEDHGIVLRTLYLAADAEKAQAAVRPENS